MQSQVRQDLESGRSEFEGSATISLHSKDGDLDNMLGTRGVARCTRGDSDGDGDGDGDDDSDDTDDGDDDDD